MCFVPGLNWQWPQSKQRVQETLANQTETRKLEKDENTKTVDDAKAAQDAVAQALTVLKEYYSGVQLVQTTAGSSLKGKAPEIFEGWRTHLTGPKTAHPLLPLQLHLLDGLNILSFEGSRSRRVS